MHLRKKQIFLALLLFLPTFSKPQEESGTEVQGLSDQVAAWKQNYRFKSDISVAGVVWNYLKAVTGLCVPFVGVMVLPASVFEIISTNLTYAQGGYSRTECVIRNTLCIGAVASTPFIVKGGFALLRSGIIGLRDEFLEAAPRKD